jgi:autotransporter translocation and assembly factor TamB
VSARPLRLLLRSLGILVALVVVLSVVLAAVSQTPTFKEWVRGVVVRQANRYLNGSLRIDRLGGSLFTSVELQGVTLQHEGHAVVRAEHIMVRYHPLTLIRGGITLENLSLVKPIIYLERGADGWNFGRLLKRREPRGASPSIGLQEIEITSGRVDIRDESRQPTVLGDVNALLSFSSSPDQIALGIRKLSSTVALNNVETPEIHLRHLSGSANFRRGDVDVRDLKIITERSDVTARFILRDSRTVLDATFIGQPVSLPELGQFVPGLDGMTLEPRLSADAKGRLDELHIAMTLDSPAGRAAGPLVADLLEPRRSLRGSLDLERFNVVAILPALGETRVTGQTEFEVTLPEDSSGLSRTLPRAEEARPVTAVSFRFTGPDVNAFGYSVANLDARGVYRDHGFNVEGNGVAYGASVRARATVQLPRVSDGPFSYKTSGQFTNLDLTRLPPRLPAVPLRSMLAGSFEISGQRDQWAAHAMLNESTAEGATIDEGTTVHVASKDGQLQYASSGSVRNLDVQRLGEPLNLPTLVDDRFRGRLNATFTMTGDGRTLDALRLHVNADLWQSEAAGGRLPQLRVDVNVADRRLATLAHGSFESINLAALGFQRTEPTELTGSTEVSVVIDELGTAPILDHVEATGWVTLAKSTVEGVTIDSAEVKGAYAHRVGQIENLAIAGPDLTATASGVLALDDQTESNLQYDVTASDLELVAKLVNRPVQGTAHVKGTVTGRTAELVTEGTLTASQVQYGNQIDVLTLTSQYPASFPQLDFKQASGRASSRVALAKVSGFELSEITAETTYQAPQLEFQTTFAERRRAVELAGVALLHPDHQEVHLRTLSLGLDETVWQLTAGQESVIRYGNQIVTVSGLDLQRAEQRVALNGTFLLGNGEGAPSVTHDVELTAERLQVGDLNELMLGERQISGVLNGSARVTGSASAPEVDGTFNLTNGEVDGVKFDSFGGDVDYRDRSLHVDVRLDQSPGVALTALGTLPASVFRASENRGDEPVDLRVESDTIDMGLFQSLTGQVSELHGQLQLSLRATGPARTPRVDGNVTIADAGFRVTNSGVVYSNLDTRLRFLGDRLIVDQFSILDDDGDLLNAEGALGIQERRISTLDVLASGSQFKILDNDLGHVELDLLARISGEAQQPVIEGNVETRAGRLEVDRLLEQLTASPYRLESADPDEPSSTSGSLWDATMLALKIHVADNMLLRGNDIRARFSRIGLGDVNMTIGGNLDLRKEPKTPTALVGSVAVVRGFYDFQGRRFEIERDSLIRFEGIEPLNPTLRIAASREISGVVAQVNLRGTVRAPELTLSSQPPLDEADILSLIAFNAPVNALGQNQRVRLVERAGALAAGYVTAPLADSIADVLDLDLFEIRTVGDSGVGPSLSVGQQFGSRLYVGFQQEFGATDMSQLSFEYRLTELLRMVTSIAQGTRRTHRSQRIETGAADLILVISY